MAPLVASLAQDNMAHPASLAAASSKPLLVSRLHDAETDYGVAVRESRAGVTAAALDLDVERWRALGAAIVDLARLVRVHCAASLFCDARPEIEALAVRLVESIDDQLDAPAWSVIDAQARLDARLATA